MKHLAIVIILSVLGVAWALAQNASVYKAESGIPEVVNIRATMSDAARVCVEPPGGGLMACRSIGELRKWIREARPK